MSDRCSRQKALDVVAVYGGAAIVAEVVAQRLSAAKCTERVRDGCSGASAGEDGALCRAPDECARAPFSTPILTDPREIWFLEQPRRRKTVNEWLLRPAGG